MHHNDKESDDNVGLTLSIDKGVCGHCPRSRKVEPAALRQVDRIQRAYQHWGNGIGRIESAPERTKNDDTTDKFLRAVRLHL